MIHPADLHHLGYADFKGRVFTGGGALECLILPGHKKELFYDTSCGRGFGDLWESLWSQAAGAVNRSEKIALCGSSLLPVDQRARELVLIMPKRQTDVTVVCGSQSERIAGDFRAAGLQHVRVFAGGYFEEWVKAAVNESLRP